jgi:hypothetical protein
MTTKGKNLTIAAVLALIFIIPFFIFFARNPVLIVTDLSFITLSGESRSKDDLLNASVSLFRQVKPVVIADDASADIVQVAIDDVSNNPFCVIFPLRFAQPARVYREKKPEIPVIILEGRYPENTNPAASVLGNNKTNDYFFYKTDISADFYRAGLAAAVIDGEKNDRIAVFVESHVQSQAREAVIKAFKDMGKPQLPQFYTTYAQFNDTSDFSCAILAGSGAEFLEKNKNVPVIFFSWVDTQLLPNDVLLVFNDSPLVQAVEAVRMVNALVSKGLIKSKRDILPNRNINKDTLLKLKKIS